MDCNRLCSTHNILINHGVVGKAFGLGMTAEVGSREGMRMRVSNNSESKIQNALLTVDSEVTTMPGESACFSFFLDGSLHLCKAKQKL